MKRLDYDRISGRYDRSRRFGPELTRELAGLLPPGLAPRAALDAGCGTGNATRCLREAWPQARVIGLDLSAGMLSRAGEKLSGVGLVRGDAGRLPFIDGAFDLIFSAYMLHHLKNPAEFYAGAARALAPGGKLIVLTASHRQIRGHFLNQFFPRFGEIDCARFPDLPAVREGLSAAGLAPEAERPMVVADYALDDKYLERVRNRHISTFELMSEAEFAGGLARLAGWIGTQGVGEKEAPRHRARGTLVLAGRAGRS